MSLHAEFWTAIMEPDADRRITLASAWLKDWVEVARFSVLTNGAMFSAPKDVAAHMFEMRLQEAKQKLGLEVVRRAGRVADVGCQPWSFASRTDIEVSVLLGPPPRPWPGVFPLKPEAAP
jgi:hypothetical protein